MRTRVMAAVVAAALVPALAACGSEAPKQQSSTVTVLTHDSFALPKPLVASFEKKTGLKVRILKSGDVGTLTNKLVLTKDSPVGDAVYGIDNTFASRAYAEGALADHTPAEVPASAADYALNEASGAAALTPVDYSDVCVNVDTAWFARKKLAPPRTLEDLAKPAYQDLMVTPAATTSSTGLAFLTATVAKFGNGWQDYWKSLVDNGLQLEPGWTEAYEGAFTAGGGNGTRPIVVSYSSSPPFTIPEGSKRPTTQALLDTCFRQVEYAGVLKGASNAAGAAKFVDFMLSPEVQAALPDNMYVYPVDSSVKLPALWARWAPKAPKPWQMQPDEITAKRTEWLRDWRDITSQ